VFSCQMGENIHILTCLMASIFEGRGRSTIGMVIYYLMDCWRKNKEIPTLVSSRKKCKHKSHKIRI
jgi:hypothetical protein